MPVVGIVQQTLRTFVGIAKKRSNDKFDVGFPMGPFGHMAMHACTYVMLRKPMTLNASAKWRHQSRSASSPISKSFGDEPPPPLQCAAARQPMMALLLGSTEAPIKAYSQPARASEVT